MNSDLAKLREDLNTVSDDVRKTFTSLSPGQLNWKPSAEKWSVGQCFEHLLSANTGMIASVEGKIEVTSPTTFWERLPLLPRFFGKVIGNAVSPEGQRKIKAPKVFEPSASDVDASIVESFLGFQPKIAAAMERCGNVDIVMGSPAAAFITYSLLDAFRIVVRHEQRHLLQAKRVVETVGFPK